VKMLKVDYKWSIKYNPKNNDRPEWWYRYGVAHSKWEGSNADLAMFYALLEEKVYDQT